MLGFSSFSLSLPSPLLAGSCGAVRLRARLMLAAGKAAAMPSPAQLAALDAAYRQQRADWRMEMAALYGPLHGDAP